ncbi:Clp protease N-terminal domain-containing protein [Marinactinospora rubrisoli]|uniref:Clp protease N-terminal domain-containing protein n=1 Tax=Marinactinospora rubrisoli TaxID=2715399 RepID=A0ABW2KME9_9ACTN
MPKINVYLPDELAEAVRDTGVPVSAVCQRALEQAVRRITAIRQSTLTDLTADDLAERLPNFTPRARAAVSLAVDRARADGAPAVGTGHLLAGMLDEGGNLALHVLRAVEIDPDQVQRDLAGRADAEPGATGPAGQSAAARFSGPAAAALELTVTEATSLGHNYVGCEHLLLGLVTEPDGAGGQVLRALGAEARLTRRAVAAALAGYVHLRAQTAAAPAGDPAAVVAAAVRQQLQPLVARIERLEHRLDVTPDAG